jgi:hypothetical protein
MTLGNPERIETEVAKAYREGRLRVCSSTQLSPTTGEAIRALLKNPDGTDSTFHIVRISSTASAGPTQAHLFENPDTGLPSNTDASVANPNRELSPQIAGVFETDTGTTELSGGNDLGIEFGIPAGKNDDEGNLYALPENNTVGLSITSSVLVGEDAWLNVWYIIE